MQAGMVDVLTPQLYGNFEVSPINDQEMEESTITIKKRIITSKEITINKG